MVACFGNVLRGDDGFGAAVAQRLDEQALPPGVEVAEVGIGGIHLVQALLEPPADAVLVVDATDLGRPPGTVMVQRPAVPDVHALDVGQRRDLLADMHYATPERAFLLARGLGVLPDATFVIGCQPQDADRYGEGLSSPVEAAVDVACREVHRLLTELRAGRRAGPARTGPAPG